jgi:hypothetical protein
VALISTVQQMGATADPTTSQGQLLKSGGRLIKHPRNFSGAVATNYVRTRLVRMMVPAFSALSVAAT